MAIAFRKKSLEKLSSPEQLDTLVRITTPGGWVALATLGFCLGIALVWGVYGRVPTKLTGHGLLLNPGGLLVINAPSSGVVASLPVTGRQSVEKGDVLATIRHSNEELIVVAAENKLKELRNTFLLENEEEASSLLRKKRELDARKDEILLNIRINQSKVDRLNERIKSQEELLNHGLITRYELSGTTGERDNTEDTIAIDRSRLAGIENEYAQAKRERVIKLNELENQIKQAVDDLAVQQAILKEATVISSPGKGIVIGMGTVAGARVAAGDELLTLELIKDNDEKSLLALQYYPAATAKRIKPGMMTQIAPGTVKVDQFGYLLAQVIRVAEFPASTAQLRTRLQNDELVKQIEQLGTVFEVESVLLDDGATASGYKWTSSQGPPYPLEVGTPCATSVIVEEMAPLRLVVPMVRKHLLGIGEERS